MNYTYLPILSENDSVNILGFISSPYTAILGNFFWLFIGVLVVSMVFLKAQDVALPVIIGILFAAAFGMFLPKSAGVTLLMLLGTGVGAILYKVFKTGEGY
ncbi:MAG TPA: hypothetical protein HA306_01120 [Methanosarcina sp.]|nr:hypothetical protein [Methanosarcina sp.]